MLRTIGAERYMCRSGSSAGREFAGFITTVVQLSSRWGSATISVAHASVNFGSMLEEANTGRELNFRSVPELVAFLSKCIKEITEARNRHDTRTRYFDREPRLKELR